MNDHTPGESRHDKPEPAATEHADGAWPQIRRLVIFQIKLYVDALRDLIMSPFSIIAVIIDLIFRNRKKASAFESLLHFGRKTEKAINLFNQHDVQEGNIANIDAVIDQLELRLRQESGNGAATPAANTAWAKALEKIRENLRNLSDYDTRQ